MSLFSELKRRNVLRVAAAYIAVSWLVIQVIEALFPMFGLSDAAARGIVIALAIGFIPVLILSWVFEITPKGLQRDADVDPSQSIAHAAGRKIDFVIIAVLVVALSYFIWDPLEPTPYGDKSIAVMPFINLSSDPEQEYFSDGISEELLNLLAQIQELRVISRTSSFALKDKELSTPEIGERLKVAHILEGSIRKSGNRIRITAQLIEAATDTHLWSQNYDRELEDIFVIQDEIAQLVVDELRIELFGEMPKAIRTDPVVLTLMLQARRVAMSDEPDKHDRAIVLLEEALSIDPNYVPALYQLILGHYFRTSNAQPFDADAFEQAQAIIAELHARALAVDPDNGKVLAWRAWTSFEYENDFQAAAHMMEKAVAAASGDEVVLRSAGSFAMRIGHFETSLALKSLAAERNPECIQCINLWLSLVDAQRYDEAIASRLSFTGDNYSYYALVLAALLKEDAELALEYATPDRVNANSLHAFRAMAFHSLGRADEAQAEFGLQTTEWRVKDPVFTAMATLWLGDEEVALDLLYDRYWPHMHNFYQTVLNPVWIPLHDNPRWTALREQSGFTKEALAIIKFNPVLPE